MPGVSPDVLAELERVASSYAETIDRSNLVPGEVLERLSGLGVFDFARLGFSGVVSVVRTLSRFSPGLAHVVLVHSSSLVAGDLEYPGGVVAFSVTEPGGGSDVLANLRTTAVVEGGVTRVRGEKLFTSNAPYASHFLVLAAGSEGPSLYLVPRSDRVRVEPMDLLGLRGAGTSRVVYDDAEAGLVGTPGKGLKEALRGINLGRLGYAAIALGIVDSALRIIVDYASSKVVFGKRLIEYQGLRWRIADLAMKAEALDSLVRGAAAEADEQGGVDPYKAAVAKNLGASLAQEAAWTAAQALGGRGLARWSHTERMMRDSRVLDIGEGSREVLLDFIASRIIKRLGGSKA
ncbi:MAG: acyl-CoA/acyl-ACP dehydrogenase [Desulfurococcales archaeon]|nr:acyl-CoA/acyl-ACP dehydrogenase [Desulfurococcales archaeon]